MDEKRARTPEGQPGKNRAEVGNTKDPEDFDWRSCCLWPTIAVFGIVLMAWFSGCGHHEDEKEKPSSSAAMYLCRDLVKNQLKNPDSAQFSDEQVSGYGTYTVTGTVRGENSFGGMAVHQYTCTATWDDDSESYDVKMRAE